MKPARIGWATPWNVESAIAKSASEVATELARRGHSITVLRTETDVYKDIAARPSAWPVHFLSDVDEDALRRDFDIVVAHIGDHYGFHGALLSRLDSVPIFGIFHDLCIAHLMLAWLSYDESRIGEVVRSTYAGTPSADAPLKWNDLAHVAAVHPMLEWAGVRTIGAVAHAQHYVDRLRAVCRGPVDVIPLAYEVSGLPLPPPPFEGGITVAVIGHANTNKRIDQILLAISASSLLRERCRLKIIGHASDAVRDDLVDYAAVLGIKPPIFTGWVPDDVLRRELREVDVIACLRDPVLEGASASLIVALTSGRPTLVSNHGPYAEVPDDAIFKCEPGNEALGILLALEDTIRRPAHAAAVGERGRAFVADRHTAVRYVDHLEPLLETSIGKRPVRVAKDALAATLASFGLNWTDPAMDRMREVLDSLTSRSDRRSPAQP